jgi:DNA-directed RNA polymerase specialized sigma24 family protein
MIKCLEAAMLCAILVAAVATAASAADPTPLRRYARALTRDRDRADDLVQDTLGRALAKEQFWQPGTSIRA